MFDRRLLTDIGLALLIALPSALPAAPNPWNANDQVGKPEAQSAQTQSYHRELLADSSAMSRRGYGRS